MDTLNGKLFTAEEAAVLLDVIASRRDVRGNRFLDRPIEPERVEQLLTAALHAPSVGFSQPWEFVLVQDSTVRRKIRESFDTVNTEAAASFGDRQDDYRRMKLEGILEAPLNIAVFYTPSQGPVLGQTAMPEAGLYSVVCAVQNLWLMARALNIGVGWVSILNEGCVRELLGAAPHHRLVAYLCVGYTDGFFTQPELELLNWEKRKERNMIIRTI
jgi:5,6-dimethylbenzimidazole synthase